MFYPVAILQQAAFGSCSNSFHFLVKVSQVRMSIVVYWTCQGSWVIINVLALSQLRHGAPLLPCPPTTTYRINSNSVL